MDGAFAWAVLASYVATALGFGGLLTTVWLRGLNRLDRLSERMEDGFRRVDERMDAGFRAADERMDAGFRRADERMDAGFRRMEVRFTEVDQRLDVLERAG